MIKVLVLTYNQEDYLPQTLDSIVAQEVSVPYEIVVANDCSSDGTAIVCDNYAKKYPDLIRVIHRPQNYGLIKNFFSLLLDEWDCDYFALCAGDDYWIDNNKLQKQFDYLEQNTDCSVVITGYKKLYDYTGNFESVYEWKSKLLKEHGKEAIEYVLNEDFSFFPVGSSSMFRGRETAKLLKECESLYSVKILPGEGMILFSLFALMGRYAFISDLTTVYRIQEKSACHFEDKDKVSLFKLKYLIQKMDVADYYILPYSFRLKQFFHACVSGVYSLYEGDTEKILSFIEYSLKCRYKRRTLMALKIMRFLVKNRLITKILYTVLTYRKSIIQTTKKL